MAASDLTAALQQTNEVDLTVTGRKSGQESDRLLLLPVSGSDSNWYRNIVKTPEVKLTANGAELAATARPIEDPAGIEDVVERFRGKYGADRVADYYPKTDAAIEVPLS
jgi:hypothetical protein